MSASIDNTELRDMFKKLGINLNFIQVLAVMAAADTDKRWVWRWLDEANGWNGQNYAVFGDHLSHLVVVKYMVVWIIVV